MTSTFGWLLLLIEVALISALVFQIKINQAVSERLRALGTGLHT